MNPIRERIRAECAPSGAFVRVDRGDGLYVTDLPRRAEDWPARAEALRQCGLYGAPRGALWVLTPGPVWRAPMTAWLAARVKAGPLTEDFERLTARDVCAEEAACWLMGLKRLESGDEGDYERRLRQTAAVALRAGCGGLLYGCGLCLDAMKTKGGLTP